MHAFIWPSATSFFSMGLAVAAWCAAPHRAFAAQAPVAVHPLSARLSAEVVQNTIGNAYALKAGLSPRLRLRDVPLGVTLLAEYGMLRDTRHHLFSVPSAQLLMDWAVAERLELAAGAGVQWWFAPSGPLTRPVVTLEARYVPATPMLNILRSFFAASSLGASSGAGLQVRAGLEFAFGPTSVASQPTRFSEHDIQLTCPPPAPCPPCPIVKPVSALTASVTQPRSPRALQFAFNVSILDAASLAYLKSIGTALAAHNTDFHHVEVVGHASARGTQAHNLTVSLRRANNVARALIKAGASEHMLTVHGLGATSPIPNKSNNDPAQQRVMLTIVGGDPEGPLSTLTDLTFAPSEGTYP